ncbi:Sulfatase family protein [hydrothermal vent metagenome]|uniref:Sulfatase family protein n=1 Tax=hydrothermal vent metagenome TaxID=652676 RepID=A0A1W1D1I6_9ZZZZ
MPKLFKFILSILFVEMLLLSLFKLAFLWIFYTDAGHLSFDEILYAFFIGWRFDIQLLVLITLPLLLFGGIKNIAFFENTYAKKFWITYLTLTLSLVILLYGVNFGYYDFFKRLVDSSILRYFYDMQEAFKMLQEGYPVYSSILGFFFFVTLIIVFYTKLYTKISKSSTKIYTKSSKILFITSFSLVYIFAGYGKLELYPWRWSEAFYSSKPFLSSIASNPATYFINTLKNSGEKYNSEKVKVHYDDIASFLEVKNKDTKDFSLARIKQAQHSKALTLDKPNIIFVLGESTSYARTSMSNNPLNPTPFLNSLAKKGLTYSRYFSPHTGTARSVFASLTGLYDVERMKTSSRNPMVVKQHLILNSLASYEKHYFIGGSLSWGNVRGLISNIKGIHTREASSYDAPHNDVWGISDADLLLEAHETFKQAQKPFFAFVQLSGNHSPWTIPKNNYGFEKRKNLKKADLLAYGFDGEEEEFHAQNFMDYAIENFFKTASSSKYMQNTIFIFVGDHGLFRQSKHRHPSFETLALDAVNTPLIIYAPSLFGHQKIDHSLSEVDIMPTIAGLSGEQYINSTFGRDILHKDFGDKEHYAFYIQHGHNPLLTLIGDKYIYRIRADSTKPELYASDYQGDAENISQAHPNIAQKMQKRLLGLYEMTRYTRYHNSGEAVNKSLKKRVLK